MKKTFLQVLYERITGPKEPAVSQSRVSLESTAQAAPEVSSASGHSDLSLKEILKDLRAHQQDGVEPPASPMISGPATRSFTTAEQTVPAEFLLEEYQPPAALPIPPRAESTLPFQTSPIRTPQQQGADHRPTFRVEVSYNSRSSNFTKEAKKLAKHRETSASFVPFMSYRPTYSDMGTQQRRWYFYWRDLVRQGQFVDTDLSYIYLLAYELINSVGVSGQENSYNQLLVLWRQYRDRFDHLDDYLPDWLEDYAFVHHLTVDPSDLLLEYDPKHWWYRFDDFVTVYSKDRLSRMPLDMLARLSGHEFEQSNFFQDGNQEVVSRFVGLGLDAIDRHLRATSKKGKGIFETFAPPAGRRHQRDVFSGAHYDGPQAKRTVRTAPVFAQHEPLREFLKGITKYTENRLREATGFKTRLRNFEILEEHRLIIDRSIPVVKLEPEKRVKVKSVAPEPAEASIKIDLDISRVQALQAESNEVRAMLLEGIEENENVSEFQAPIHVSAATVAPVVIVHEPATPHSALSPWQALSRLLSDAEIRILKALLDGQHVMSILRDVAFSEQTMPELLLDKINEAALGTIGDAIFDAGNSEPTVFADYYDDIQKLIESRRP